MIFIIMGQAESGKDLTASLMKDELNAPTAITHYADYLKWLYKHYFAWDGVKTEKARTDLQTIGTEIVRDTYDPDFWVDRVIEQIQIFNGQFTHFIIPDARFYNEVEKVEEVFGTDQVITIKIIRPEHESMLTADQKAHRSERDLDNYVADFTIQNTSIAELRRQIQWIIRTLNE